MPNLNFRRFSIVASVAIPFMTFLSGIAHAQDEGTDAVPKLYKECGGCHNLRTDNVGPRHCGVMGRPAASIPDFTYSAAMQESGIVWDEEQLDGFLKSPFTYVSGTMMGYFGIQDEKERAEVIAFLKTLTPDSPLCRDP